MVSSALDASSAMIVGAAVAPYAGPWYRGGSSNSGSTLIVVGLSRVALGVVLRMPYLGRFICPLAVAGLALRYLDTRLTLKFGHPLRKPLLMALRRVDIFGLHSDWWANFKALARVQSEWANTATAMGFGFF